MLRDANALSCVCLLDFFRDDAKAFPNNVVFHRKTDTQALIAMTPILVIDPKEKVVAGHDEYATRLESLIQLAGGDRQVLEPQPKKERPFAAMNAIGQ